MSTRGSFSVRPFGSKPGSPASSTSTASSIGCQTSSSHSTAITRRCSRGQRLSSFEQGVTAMNFDKDYSLCVQCKQNAERFGPAGQLYVEWSQVTAKDPASRAHGRWLRRGNVLLVGVRGALVQPGPSSSGGHPSGAGSSSPTVRPLGAARK